MTYKRETPPAGTGGANGDNLTVCSAHEIATPPVDVQALRARWLLRRVPLEQQTALFLASLHFGESAR
jgi:hypothetical protein